MAPRRISNVSLLTDSVELTHRLLTVGSHAVISGRTGYNIEDFGDLPNTSLFLRFLSLFAGYLLCCHKFNFISAGFDKKKALNLLQAGDPS